MLSAFRVRPTASGRRLYNRVKYRVIPNFMTGYKVTLDYTVIYTPSIFYSPLAAHEMPNPWNRFQGGLAQGLASLL